MKNMMKNNFKKNDKLDKFGEVSMYLPKIDRINVGRKRGSDGPTEYRLSANFCILQPFS